MSALLITLIVFLSLLGVAIIIFNAIYLLNRRNINWDFKLKNKFNYYKNNTIGSNLKSIETLVKKNKGLEPILEYLRNCNNLYTKQLEIVKVQLQKISQELETFKILSTWRKLKQISVNFDLLDKQQQEFKNVNINTQKYLNTCSRLATQLFEIVSSITGFQKDNYFNLLHDDIPEIKVINRDINDLSILINNDINYIDANKIHSLFLSELSKIKDFYNLTFNIFDIDKYTLALDTLINYGFEIIKHNDFSATQKYDINKRIESFTHKKSEIKSLIKKGQFDKAKQTMLTSLAELEKSLIDIRIEQLYKSIYETHSKEFTENVDLFYHQLITHRIKDVYTDIVKNFKNDHEITQLIYNNIDLTNNISKSIDEFHALERSKLKDGSTIDAVQHIFKIYKYVLEFQINNQNLLVLIENRHKNFVEVIYHLHDIKLKILDLERLMSDYNIQNTGLTEKMNEKKKLLETIKTKVQTAFVDSDVIINNELETLDQFINTSFSLIKMDITLINIIKRLKMYSARYQQLATKEQLQYLDKLAKKHQYYELIDAYIEFIQRMKKLKKVS